MAGLGAAELGLAVDEPGGDVAETHDQRGVADQGPDEGRLDQRDQAALDAEEADQEIGRVAERGVEQAAGSGADAVGQLLGRGADEAGQRDDGGDGEEELDRGRPTEPSADQRCRDEDQEDGEDPVFA